MRTFLPYGVLFLAFFFVNWWYLDHLSGRLSAKRLALGRRLNLGLAFCGVALLVLAALLPKL